MSEFPSLEPASRHPRSPVYNPRGSTANPPRTNLCTPGSPRNQSLTASLTVRGSRTSCATESEAEVQKSQTGRSSGVFSTTKKGRCRVCPRPPVFPVPRPEVCPALQPGACRAPPGVTRNPQTSLRRSTWTPTTRARTLWRST